MMLWLWIGVALVMVGVVVAGRKYGWSEETLNTAAFLGILLLVILAILAILLTQSTVSDRIILEVPA